MHEYPNGYGSGPRIFEELSACQGKALYWRNSFADYGSQPNFLLKLSPGSYALSFTMAAWKGEPTYKAQILNKRSGKIVAESPVYVAEPNANGNTGFEFGDIQTHKMEFDIEEEDNYVIRFQTVSGGWSEYLLFGCNIEDLFDPSGITVVKPVENQIDRIYTPAGILLKNVQKGINIIRYTDGTVRKVLVK